MNSASKIYTFILLFASAYSFTIRQTAEAGDTVLNLLEGNVTNPQFDDDGNDFDIFSYLFAVSSRGHRLEEDIPGDITLLAPDDNAFRRAVGDLGLETSSELRTYENFLLYLMNTYLYPIDFLTRILYYHIVPGELNSTAALQLPSLATWDEPSRITRDGNTLIDRNPELPNPSFDTERMDIQASNGIIHVIDYVLFPEVMRKSDLNGLESACSTPEASLEEAVSQDDVGPLPVEDSLDMASTDEAVTETGEPSQDVENFPIPTETAAALNLDVTLSPSTPESEPLSSATTPSFDDGLLQEDVTPSQEIPVDFANGNDGNGGEDSSLTSSQQEPFDVEAPEMEPSVAEELQDSTASPTPRSVSPPDFSQATTSNDSSNVDASPLVEADNINPEASISESMKIPAASSDIAVEEPFLPEPEASFAAESAAASAAVSPLVDASVLPSPTCGSSSHATM